MGRPAAEVRIALGQGRQYTLVVSVGPLEAILRGRLASSFWGVVRVVDGAFNLSSLQSPNNSVQAIPSCSAAVLLIRHVRVLSQRIFDSTRSVFIFVG